MVNNKKLRRNFCVMNSRCGNFSKKTEVTEAKKFDIL